MALDKKFYISILLIIAIFLSNLFFEKVDKSNVGFTKINSSAVFKNTKNSIVIVGGSNSIWGIDTSSLNYENQLKNLNISIHGEGYNFTSYADYLDSLNISADILVYSSLDFSTLNNPFTLDNNSVDIYGTPKGLHFFGLVRSSTSLINLFRKSELNSREYMIDEFGNGYNFTCTNNINPISFKPFNVDAATIFSKRIKRLSSVFKTKRVIVRFPPLYINEFELDLWNEYLNQSIKFMHDNNIETFTQTKTFYFNSESSLFCSAYSHPNKKLRLLFTRELQNYILTHP